VPRSSGRRSAALLWVKLGPGRLLLYHWCADKHVMTPRKKVRTTTTSVDRGRRGGDRWGRTSENRRKMRERMASSDELVLFSEGGMAFPKIVVVESLLGLCSGEAILGWGHQRKSITWLFA
jgi:hypothetical protein